MDSNSRHFSIIYIVMNAVGKKECNNNNIIIYTNHGKENGSQSFKKEMLRLQGTKKG